MANVTKVTTRKNGNLTGGKSKCAVIVTLDNGSKVNIHNSVPRATANALKRNLDKLFGLTNTPTRVVSSINLDNGDTITTTTSDLPGINGNTFTLEIPASAFRF